MNPPSSGQTLTILIIGLLGPFVLFVVPLAGIFVAPLSGLLTTGLVIHALRKRIQRHIAAAVFQIGMVLINLATMCIAGGIWIALVND
jgi:hypothetical protein